MASPSNSGFQGTYDIFLSFRGSDTRKKFTDHLFEALTREGFHTFRDDDEIERGENIKSKLRKAIENSRMSVIVLSKNYANSTACLFEVQAILKQQKNKSDHLILPVFYEVDPWNIKEQAKNLNFGEKKVTVEEVKGWSAALKEVADIAGMVSGNQSNGYEAKFIKEIVGELKSKHLRVADHLILRPCSFKNFGLWILIIILFLSLSLLSFFSLFLSNHYSHFSLHSLPTNSNPKFQTEQGLNAAFRSSRTNEAYLFMKDEYVRLNYAPGTIKDRVLYGPLRIFKGFPSLKNTAFAEPGIDCAFGSHYGDEAFIFSGSLCARINYAPGTSNDKIIEGPMTIIQMFPFFKGTVFESGVDSAFESTISDEAYLFRGNRYARINYKDPHLFSISQITEGFVSLKGTIFESGIEAAFASHRPNEAYLFKGDSYTRINFAPHTTSDYIIGGVKKILPNWPSLQGILPRKN